DHRLLHVLANVGRSRFFRIAADLADHDDRMRVGVGIEKLNGVEECGANDRVAADADAGGLSDAEFRQLADRFVGERAGARHNADVAFEMNVAWHDADLAFARRNNARAVRSDEARGLCLEERPDFHHVDHRNTFGDADDERYAGIGRFHDAVRGEWRRHEDDGRIRAGLSHRLADGVEDRTIEMLLSAFARRDTTDHVGAIGNRLLGVERALFTGEALDDEASLFIDEDTHYFLPPAAATTFSAASLMPSAMVKLKPESRRICLPCSTLVPSMRMTIGTLMPRSRAAATTPVASVSQRRMPPKILMRTAFTLASESRMRNAFLICSGCAPPPTSRKFAALPPAYWMMSMVPMARPAPFTMQPMVPSSLM